MKAACLVETILPLPSSCVSVPELSGLTERFHTWNSSAAMRLS